MSNRNRANAPPAHTPDIDADAASLDERSNGGHDVEHGARHRFSYNYGLGQASDDNYFDVGKNDRVHRLLNLRQIMMLAISGIIGTGLLVGSGDALRIAGPLGVLLAFGFVGSISYSMIAALTEMTVHAPISGTFPHYAARYVDPALGFAVGWNYFYSCVVTPPLQINAASLIVTVWDHNLNHQAAYTTIFIIATCAVNLIGVRYFGDVQSIFALLKITLIIGLILGGIIIDLGGSPTHDRIGFRYWQNPGALNEYLEPGALGRFLALVKLLVTAAFSFQGFELVAIGAAETESPRRNIPKATWRVYRLVFTLYMLGVLIAGLLVPSNDQNLLQESGTSQAQSPFVTAAKRAMIRSLPSVINAGILTSALSSGNTYLYCASRVLYGLSLRGQAPAIFSRCTKRGLPIVSVLFCCLFTVLAYMSVKVGGAEVFNWFVSITTVAGFFAYGSICLSHLRFYYGMKAQKTDRKTLPYRSSLQPYLSYWGLFWFSLFIVINGYDSFFHFNKSKFLTAYINIPIFFISYFVWKWYKKTRIWSLNDMDFVTGIPTLEETERPEVPPTSLWGKISAVLF